MCLAVVIPAKAGVITNVTTTTSGNRINVVKLTVDRDAAGSLTYALADLIRIDVTAFVGGNNSNIIVPHATATEIPAIGTRAGLLEDDALNTGLLNIKDSGTALTVNFLSPVRNDPGPDVLFFEINPDANNNGDPVMVINGANTRTYPGSPAINYVKFASMGSMDTLKTSSGSTPASLDNLENWTYVYNSNVTQNAYGLAIDLTDLGVAAGDSVTSLSFRSTSTNYVDPLFIAGLPAVPEPSSLAIALAVSALALVPRRRPRRTGLRGLT